jgi:5-methylcytosine-specific restriction endonuclease McrA
MLAKNDIRFGVSILKRIMKHIELDKLKSSISNSKSWDATFRHLGFKCSRTRIKNICTIHQIDYSHFTGQGWNKGNTKRKEKTETYLSNKKPIKSINLKRRLFEEGIKEQKCERCNRTEWEGQPISLELHHIDGNTENNFLNNLQIVCPNCHALTPNYRGLNQKRIQYRKRILQEEWTTAINSSYNRREACIKLNIAPYGGNYKTIDKIISKYNLQFLQKPENFKPSIRVGEVDFLTNLGETIKITGNIVGKNKYPEGCNWRRQPRPLTRKVERPSKEQLEKLVWEKPILQISKDYSVSDNSIRKWCKQYGITNTPPSQYWPRIKAGWTHENALSPIKAKQPLKRLTDEQVKEIFGLLKENNLSLREIATRYNINHSVIVRLKQGHTYKHVSSI